MKRAENMDCKQKQKRERPAGSPPPVGFASFRRTITKLNITEILKGINKLNNSVASVPIGMNMICFAFSIYSS